MPSLFDSLMSKGPASGTTEDTSTLGAIQTLKKAPGTKQSDLESAVIKQTGQEQLQAGQQTMQKQAALGEQTLAGQQMEAQKAESARSIALQKLADKNDQRLASLNSEAANAIAAESRTFKKDSTNRNYMNQQMLDQYAAESLLNNEQLQNYVQQKDLIMQRKVQLMDTYSKKLQQAIEQGYLSDKQQLDQVSREKLARIAAAFEQKKAEAARKLQKNSAMKSVITGAFTAAGAVVGGIWNFGAGAPVGAAAGSALGSMVGGAVSENAVD